MAYHPFNYINAPLSKSPMEGLAEALRQGFELANLPQNTRQLQESRGLANAFRSLRNQQEPERFRLQQEGKSLSNDMARMNNANRPIEQQINNEKGRLENITSLFNSEHLPEAFRNEQENLKARTSDLNNPFNKIKQLDQSAQGAYSLELLKNYLPGGENNPVYKRAEEKYNLDNESQRVLNSNRTALTNTANKRASSPLGKLLEERNDIESGFKPGTNRQEQLDPRQQQTMLDNYDTQIQKNISDSDARKRARFAENMEKTIDSIDVNALTQYAGLSGGINKKLQQGLALFGNENKAYDAYKVAETAAHTLVEQARSFYGSSVQEASMKRLESLANPAGWLNNPKLAKQQLEQFLKILEKESDTYYQSLEKPLRNPREQNQERSDVLGLGI